MTLPPKGSSVIRLPPTKGRRVVGWIPTNSTPKIPPESVIFWKQLGWFAILLLAAVICTLKLIEQLAIEQDGPQQFPLPDSVNRSVVDGEVGVINGQVGVVDGQVGVVNSVGSRVPPVAGRR